MGGPSRRKRARLEAGPVISDVNTTQHTDDPHAMLRSALNATAARLAKHSAAAQSLVSAEEGAAEAAITCCGTLLREHAVGLDTATEAVMILSRLAESDRTTWRDLPRLREQPLNTILAACDEPFIQQLHTISEVLQFPKHVSLLLQRQLAVFRIRGLAASDERDTATLVRAEAVLEPLLEQASAFLHTHVCHELLTDCGLPMTDIRAFWRGFFGDPEDVESLDIGSRELDHIAYGAGRILGGRGLLPDLLRPPSSSCVCAGKFLPEVASVVGDTATIAALHHTGHAIDTARCVDVAAFTGQVEVLRLCITLGWELDADMCVDAAAAGNLTSDVRMQVLSVLQKVDPDCDYTALACFSGCGDLQCVRMLLETGDLDAKKMGADAVVKAAEGGHIPVLSLLLEKGAVLSAVAFQASEDVVTLQWCMEHGCSVDGAFIEEAARFGRLFQLKWAASVTDIAGFLNADVFAAAAMGGDVRMMKWLRQRACPWDSRVLTELCELWREEWHCLAFALRHGCPTGGFSLRRYIHRMTLDEVKSAVQALNDSGRSELVELPALFLSAREAGDMPVAEWLVCDLDVPVAAVDCVARGGWPLGSAAAGQGCLQLLQHLCEKGLHKPSASDYRAVLRDSRSVEVVRWLHARGAPTYGSKLDLDEGFDLKPHHPAVDAPEFLTFMAARRNAVELLRVLVEECGAHWTESACAAAAEEGHMEVLRWALSKHWSCAVDTWCAAVRRGGKSNNFHALALLHREKRPWTEAVWEAAAPYPDVRAWLQVRGCPGSAAPPADEDSDGEGAERA